MGYHHPVPATSNVNDGRRLLHLHEQWTGTLEAWSPTQQWELTCRKAEVLQKAAMDCARSNHCLDRMPSFADLDDDLRVRTHVCGMRVVYLEHVFQHFRWELVRREPKVGTLISFGVSGVAKGMPS